MSLPYCCAHVRSREEFRTYISNHPDLSSDVKTYYANLSDEAVDALWPKMRIGKVIDRYIESHPGE